MTGKRLMLPAEVMEACHLSYLDIWRKMREGTFPISVVIGRSVAWLSVTRSC